MPKATGKTKVIVATVTDIERDVGQALAYIDTTEQYKIRNVLEKAIKKCQEIRNQYDPI